MRRILDSAKKLINDDPSANPYGRYNYGSDQQVFNEGDAGLFIFQET
jgi:hypothetical protein